MIATDRNASKPSRKTMMSAGIMESLSEVHCRFADHLHAIGRSGVLAVAAAGIADAEDLQIVKSGSEFFATADLELAFFEDRVVEFDHRAASRADQMIVM